MAGDAGAKRSLLRRVPVLDMLTEERLDELVDVVVERAFGVGETVCLQGATAHEVYLVLEGEVDVVTGGRTTATLGPGSVVGEVALLVNEPRMSTVVARTAATLLVLDEAAFATLLDQPEVSRQLAFDLATRLRAVPTGEVVPEATDRTAWESLTPAEQRVARAVAGGLTNSEVAAELFLSRHTVEAHLKHIFTKLGIRSRVALAVDVVPPGPA